LLVLVTKGQRKCVSQLQTIPKSVTAKGETFLQAQEKTDETQPQKIPLQNCEKWEIWSSFIREMPVC